MLLFSKFLGHGAGAGNLCPVNPLDSKSRTCKRLCLQLLRGSPTSQALNEAPGLRLNRMRVHVEEGNCGPSCLWSLPYKRKRFDLGAFIPPWGCNTIFHNSKHTTKRRRENAN